MAPTILVFDSGLGGLTVFREIGRVRPDAAYVYVADDAFFPYGNHTEDEIIARVVPLMGDLIRDHHPDLAVIACNTASTLVLPHLRANYSVPFVGTVPAIKPACARSRTKRVSVLGTRGTVKREYTQALVRDFAQGCDVTLVGSGQLAALAEAALKGEPLSDEVLWAEIAPCFKEDDHGGDNRTDTIVLACTHYPLLMDRLVALAPWPVDWIDPAPAIARRAAELLRDKPNRGVTGSARMLLTSGATPPDLAAALQPFFGERLVA